MTEITIADTETIHPLLSDPYIAELTTQFHIALSQSTQDEPMPIDMTFQEFLKDFGNQPVKALAYIDNALAEGRIEVSENTLPYYTFVAPSKPQTDTGSEYERLAQPPRFKAYADHQAQTHSFSMRIERWYEDDDSSADAIVTFDRSDNGLDWFFNNLHHELDDVTEESEMHWQDNWETQRKREREALLLQRVSYERRINATRRFLIESGASMSPTQFEQNCKDVVDLRNMATAATERIDYLLG